MKKLLFIMMAVFFIFTACQKEQNDLNPSEEGILKAAPAGCEISTTMVAGGGKYDERGTGTVVGTVTQAIVGNKVEVTYHITEPGWIIDITHLYIGKENGIPKNGGGNPKIGHFPYKVPTSSDENNAFYSIAYKGSWGTNFVISAHAGVSYSALKAITDVLPATATMSVDYPGQNTYFDVNIINGGILNGDHNGWCIDILGEIDFPDVPYEVNVYPSHGDIPNGIVDHPENFDLINWLLNQGYIGQASVCGGNYNWPDMQMAFWYLLNDGTAGEPVEEGSNACRVAELVSLAQTNGEGFVPDCLEKFAVILDPIDGAQVCIIEWTLGPCQGDETAWAYGYHDGAYVPGIPGMSFTDSPFYGGHSWGWYFYSCSWVN